MIKTNVLGTVMLVVGLSIVGEFWPCIEFSMNYPHANVNLVGAGMTLFSAVFCMTR